MLFIWNYVIIWNIIISIDILRIHKNYQEIERGYIMGKILMFIYDDMADFETVFSAHILGADLQKELITIAYEDRLIKSKSGIMYKPHKTVGEVLEEEAEALLIPGGLNGEVREELIQLIQALNDKGSLLAAICAGPRFLAKAGVLKDVKYTTSIEKWTEEHKTRYKEEDPFPRENFVGGRVVSDKNVITAQGIAFVDFAVAIIDYYKAFDGIEDRKQFIEIMTSVK